MKSDYYFSIADISFKLSLPHEIIITDAFKPFLAEETDNCVEIIFKAKNKIDYPRGTPIFKNVSFSVYEQKGQWIRVYHDYKDNEKPYGIGKIISDNMETVCFEKEVYDFFCESKNSFSHIALEELLLRQNSMILHSSFISTEYGGVLFSGPSGIGKSTQANLWIKYKNAKLLNGDRTIIKETDHVWTAHGSPYAGSSKCHINKSEYIKAIVLLQKGNENHIKRLSLKEAFVKLYPEIIVNTWNPDYVSKIMDLVYQLIKKVPVYLLSATPDYNAVKTLENVLKKESKIENR